jgi:acetoacetyl-CoA reductase
MLGLEDKVVLVSGGNRGVGAAIISLLQKLGAKVAYNDREKLDHPCQLALQADVTDAPAMEAVARRVEKELGPIYGVVANAGRKEDEFFSKLSVEQWNAVINVNLNGVFNTIRPIVPLLYERREGSLVLISSVVGEQGNVGQTNYAASKAALIGLAKSLALEGARYSVRANALSPGFIGDTHMVRSIPEEIQKKILETIPLRRFGKAEEIAWAAVFLLSPVAGGYITGATLSVNRGRHT